MRYFAIYDFLNPPNPNGTDLKDVMLHGINYYLHYSTSSKLQRSVMFIETSRAKTLAPAERHIFHRW